MISIIVAMDEKRGIGKHNNLMWKIPGELKRFKEITMGHPIIMGRKTYDSIGRILPGRTNIIITRDKDYKVEGAVIAHSLEEALRVAQGKPGKEEVFVIGGGQIFTEALPLTDKIYLTLVKGDFDADTFFPEYSEFKKVKEEKGTAGDYKYSFIELIR